MKWKFLLLGSIALAGLTGCGTSPTGSDTGNPQQPDFQIRKSNVAREAAAAPEDNMHEQAQSNNRFAVAMYQQLISEGENLFFSPYSISVALAMTAAGARDSTQQQILDALQVTLEGEAFDAAINSIDRSLTEHAETTDGITLRIVNSTWLQTGYPFVINYLDHLSRFFGAGVNMLDFVTEPEVSRGIINDWVADQTNQKILELLPQGTIDGNTVLVLTNAIYFLADWLYSFNPEYTADKDFNLLDENTISIPLMQLNEPDKKVTMLYTRSNNARALEFPYKGDRLSMTVLLPDEGTFSTFEGSLSLEVIDQMVDALTAETLTVALPKFEFTYGSKSIVEALQSLGMIDAFGGNANFSGIDGTRNLYVSNVLHKAFISVDEEGTEAAAATAVVISRWGGPDPDEVVFVANRPFIYLIRDKGTGTILFMGRVLNPSLTE
jgi:serpin B